MTKAEIVERVSEDVGFAKKIAFECVEQVFELLKNTLESGDKVKISGFGNFIVREKADRRGRNPQTGEEIVIGARKVLTFKPSPILKKSLNPE
jgi:integration host factor subunit alpha